MLVVDSVIPIEFQFTHPGRGATYLGVAVCLLAKVSIHAPREGCDRTSVLASAGCLRFQFTHPGRGATSITTGLGVWITFQFTHPGRGATNNTQPPPPQVAVSIHAPREGCDKYEQGRHLGLSVSIHAPREGCDLTPSTDSPSTSPFQFTHPGRGATVSSKSGILKCLGFQFTHPGRGAT